MKITAGETSYILDIFIQDSSATDGAGLAGLFYNTASLTAKYKRQGSSTWVTISLIPGTAGTWSSGGFAAAGSADAGDYELHLPNAAIASGVAWVAVSLQGAANMAPTKIRIGLTATNDQDAVRGGMTALPNAAADAAGGLPISDAGALDLDAILVDTNDLQTNQGNWVTATGFSTHAAADVYTAFGTGSNLTTLTTATGFATVNPDNSGVTAIKTKTDQLVFTVANQVDSNALSGGGSGATASQVRIEMDANSTKLTAIVADTNELQTNQGNWVTATGFSTHSAADVYTAFGNGSTLTALTTATGFATQASVDVIDSIVDTILVDTNELQLNQGNWVTATGFSTHSAADVYTAFGNGSNLTTLTTATGFATQASVDVIDGIVDTILVDTNDLQTNQGDWATATGFSTHSAANVLSALGTGSWATSLATQTSVNNLPTNAELTTALGTADDATLAAITAEAIKTAAIKTKTDQLAFTVANQVDSNALSGGGAGGGATASEVRIEMDSNSTKLASIVADTTIIKATANVPREAF